MIERPIPDEPDACQEARRRRLERIEAIIVQHMGQPISDADRERFMIEGTFGPKLMPHEKRNPQTV